MKSFKNIQILILGLILTINAFLLPFQALAFSPKYYISQFTELSVHESIGIDIESLERVTNVLIDYINDGSGDLNIVEEVHGVPTVYFNEKEQHHLHDILLLIKTARQFLILLNVILIILFVSLYFMNEKNKTRYMESVTKAFKIAVYTALSLLIALVVLYFIDFDWAFRKFHEIFFTNDLWLLDPRTDRLIQLMPLEFFVSFTKDWLSRVAIVLISYVLIGFVLPKRNRVKKGTF